MAFYRTSEQWDRLHARAVVHAARIKLPLALFDSGPSGDGPGRWVAITTRRHYVALALSFGYWSRCWCPAVDPTSEDEDDRHTFGSFGPFHIDFRTPAPGSDLRRDEVVSQIVKRIRDFEPLAE